MLQGSHDTLSGLPGSALATTCSSNSLSKPCMAWLPIRWTCPLAYGKSQIARWKKMTGWWLNHRTPSEKYARSSNGIISLIFEVKISPKIFELHPPKQTWNLKMDPWKRRFLLETTISRFHVNFWGCTTTQMIRKLQPKTNKNHHPTSAVTMSGAKARV